MEEDEEPLPSSLAGAVMSAPLSSVRKPMGKWRKRLWTALAIVFTLGTTAFGVMGMVRDSSFDLPLPGNVRPGFHTNGWPHRWTCPKGHDHWSAPYWSGTLVLLAITVAIGRRASIVRAL